MVRFNMFCESSGGMQDMVAILTLDVFTLQASYESANGNSACPLFWIFLNIENKKISYHQNGTSGDEQSFSLVLISRRSCKAPCPF